MCIICIDIEKNILSPLEARRNLGEMSFKRKFTILLTLRSEVMTKLRKNFAKHVAVNHANAIGGTVE